MNNKLLCSEPFVGPGTVNDSGEESKLFHNRKSTSPYAIENNLSHKDRNKGCYGLESTTKRLNVRNRNLANRNIVKINII